MSKAMIPHSRPTVDQEDIRAVARVLESGRLVQGEQVRAFEEEVSALIGAGHAAAVSSGTAALHLALLSLGVGEGDEVIIPGYVCTALLHAIRHVRATPVIADIDADTFNISPRDVKKRLTGRTRAVIVPHMFGLPSDLSEIISLGVPVIEDCAQSIGSRYHGACAGSVGELSVFSFYATKMIATGEGGMVLSDRADLIGKIWDLRDYDEKENDRVRYNYKMTDLQAALGRSQLGKLQKFVQKRREIAGQYSRSLAATGVQVPVTPPGRDHIYYRYVILLDHAKAFMERMRAAGVDCRRPVFKPLHEYLGLPGLAVTCQVRDRAVSIPIYPSLTDEDVQNIITKIKDATRTGGSRV
jgi:perosamine synthetase